MSDKIAMIAPWILAALAFAAWMVDRRAMKKELVFRIERVEASLSSLELESDTMKRLSARLITIDTELNGRDDDPGLHSSDLGR